MKKRNFDINTWLPIIVFGVIFLVFSIINGGVFLSASNLLNIINQSTTIFLAGLGMLFVATMGSTDITTGVIVAVGGCLGLMAAQRTGIAALLPIVCIGFGMVSGLLLGYLNAKRKVNSFMASLALLMGYRAVVQLLISNNSLYVPEVFKILDNTVFKLVFLIVMTLVITYIFKFTRFGNYVRGIGENEVAIRYTGVGIEKIKIAAFIISGTMAGIAGLFTVVRVGGVNSTIGNGFEMKVMMALFIGGIPVRGGEGSRVYKLIFGALTIVMLENGLVLAGLDSGVTQLIRGLVLLLAVAISVQMAKKMAYVGVQEARNQKQELIDE